MFLNFLRKLSPRLADHFEEGVPSGQALLLALRGLFGVIISGMAVVAFRFYYHGGMDSDFKAWLSLFGILGVGFLIVLTDMLVRNKQITTLSAVYFGLLLGLLLGNIFVHRP